MPFGQLLMLHLMIGLGVAAAVYLKARGPMPAAAFQVLSAIVFWPVYVPILLAGTSEPALRAAACAAADEGPCDELARAIAEADKELEAALKSLDGWAEGALAREKDRLDELREAWSAQAERIREMDRFLARAKLDPAQPPPAATPEMAGRIRDSRETIRDNLTRLHEVRRRAYDDLVWTLAWVSELASMIHLAKFTGAPASRAEQLVSQIAAAVEGLSDLTWEDAAPTDAELHGSVSGSDRERRPR